ncbi:hypothetical protein EIO60_00615|nr:hypothetical protein [Candidatus Pantoea persica]
MKHQRCRHAGNALMIAGMIVMLAGIGFSVVNQLPSVQLPALLA